MFVRLCLNIHTNTPTRRLAYIPTHAETHAEAVNLSQCTLRQMDKHPHTQKKTVIQWLSISSLL